jgi:hypothetical protein
MAAMTFQPLAWKRRAAALPMPLDAPIIKRVSFMVGNLH